VKKIALHKTLFSEELKSGPIFLLLPWTMATNLQLGTSKYEANMFNIGTIMSSGYVKAKLISMKNYGNNLAL
jgi:hypothetical protein